MLWDEKKRSYVLPVKSCFIFVFLSIYVIEIKHS